MTELSATIDAIHPLDAAAVAAARERQDRLTKPRGSLGLLEAVSVQLSGLAGQCPPPVPSPAAVAIFAGDHGVHAQGVTPWPQEVTGQMVANFLAGGAVVNALAAQAGVQVQVVEVGVGVTERAVGGAQAIALSRTAFADTKGFPVLTVSTNFSSRVSTKCTTATDPIPIAMISSIPVSTIITRG